MHITFRFANSSIPLGPLYFKELTKFVLVVSDLIFPAWHKSQANRRDLYFFGGYSSSLSFQSPSMSYGIAGSAWFAFSALGHPVIFPLFLSVIPCISEYERTSEFNSFPPVRIPTFMRFAPFFVLLNFREIQILPCQREDVGFPFGDQNLMHLKIPFAK